MDLYLYLYSTFLVLMTTQSPLQYSFTFTQSHTHSYSASISSTLLFYEAQFGVQHLLKDIFWEDWGLPTFRLEDDHSATAARWVAFPQKTPSLLWVGVITNHPEDTKHFKVKLFSVAQIMQIVRYRIRRIQMAMVPLFLQWETHVHESISKGIFLYD